MRGRQGVPSRPRYNPKAGSAIWLCPVAILMRFEVFILHSSGLLSIFAGCDIKVGRVSRPVRPGSKICLHSGFIYYGRE